MIVPILELYRLLSSIVLHSGLTKASFDNIVEVLRDISRITIPCIVITNASMGGLIQRFLLEKKAEECHAQGKCIERVGNIEFFVIMGKDPAETCRLVLRHVGEIVE